MPRGPRDFRVGRLNPWLSGLIVVVVQPLMRRSLAKHFDLSWTKENADFQFLGI